MRLYTPPALPTEPAKVKARIVSYYRAFKKELETRGEYGIPTHLLCSAILHHRLQHPRAARRMLLKAAFRHHLIIPIILGKLKQPTPPFWWNDDESDNDLPAGYPRPDNHLYIDPGLIRHISEDEQQWISSTCNGHWTQRMSVILTDLYLFSLWQHHRNRQR